MDTDLSKLLISVAAPLFSFFGAIGGVYLARTLQNKAWKREARWNWGRDLMVQRMQIVERAAAIISKRYLAKILNDHLTRVSETAEIVIQGIMKEDGTIDKCRLDRVSADLLEIGEAFKLKTQLEELSAEFSAVANLACVYFSVKVREAFMPSASQRWFDLGDIEYRNILVAMGRETISDLHESSR